MIEKERKIRIRYGETDQMGYAHHANYPLYVEESRMDFLRSLGLDYKQFEESGIIMPVISMNFKFMSPVYYDDILTVKTVLNEIPETRLKLDYEIRDEDNKLMCKANTVLAFVDKYTRKPMRIPESILMNFKLEVKNLILNE